MDQEVKGQKAKSKLEVNEISARASGQFYRGGETTGILRWDEIDNEIQLEAINISTELAIKNKMNNEDQDIRETVPVTRTGYCLVSSIVLILSMFYD